MIFMVCNCKSSENAPQHQFIAIGYQAIVTCLVSVFIVCIFRSIYAPTPDLEPIIERMSKSRDGERQIFICQRVSIYTADNIYIQRTKSIPFSEILCMIFATCISGVQNDRQRILMFCNVLGLSSKFIFLILLSNTIRNGLCSKIFLFSSIWTSVSSTKKKKMKKLHIMYIDNIILQTLKGPPPLDLSQRSDFGSSAFIILRCAHVHQLLGVEMILSVTVT